MEQKRSIKKLEKIFSKCQSKLSSNGMSVRIENEDRSFVWEQSCGDLKGDQPFLIASVTKLFAATVILNLIQEGKLSFDDKIITYLPEKYRKNLHTYKGIDYTNQLTVRHLMTQTSGLPDYFTESSCKDYFDKELMKHDQVLTLDDIVERTQKMEAKFAPGSRKKSYYSDANWDLFRPIVEQLSGMSIKECYHKYIIKPLELKHTYLYTEGMSWNVPGFYVDDGIYTVPKLALAWPMSGSIVSNNSDMIAFLKAFWGGMLFNLELLQKENTYNYNQYFPMEYGVGNARFRYPGVPAIYGHSGATGVVCYYAPKYKMYISACINEYDEVKATKMLGRFAHLFGKLEKR